MDINKAEAHQILQERIKRLKFQISQAKQGRGLTLTTHANDLKVWEASLLETKARMKSGGQNEKQGKT